MCTSEHLLYIHVKAKGEEDLKSSHFNCWVDDLFQHRVAFETTAISFSLAATTNQMLSSFGCLWSTVNALDGLSTPLFPSIFYSKKEIENVEFRFLSYTLTRNSWPTFLSVCGKKKQDEEKEEGGW